MKFAKLFTVVFVALLANAFIIQVIYSTQWGIAHDQAPLLYEAFLVQTENRIAYRDVFDFQMPGAFLAYYALGMLSGFNALALRVIDLAILAAISALTFSFMRRFGNLAAFTAIFLFGLKYMQGGAYMSLQREYLFLLLVVIALWITLRGKTIPRPWIGFLFGAAAMIKPHAAIGLLPLIGFDWAEQFKHHKRILPREVGAALLPTAIGFFIPILIVFLWLAFSSALIPFVNIAQNYWGLYAQINGYLEVTTSAARAQFILTRLFFMDGNFVWLIPAALGIYWLPKEHQRTAYLLAGLALCYAIYPALSGQFFTYHYIPFMYFISLLAALALTGKTAKQKNIAALVLILAVIMNIRPSSTFARQLIEMPVSPTTARADEISAYLKTNLAAGETVQPLDWTGGALLAMLQTRASLATPYVFDFYFYHHVSSPYIQKLRDDFISALEKSKPRFVIEVTAEDKPWVTGLDTSREFPALRAFLNENYRVVVAKADYQIYERK